MNIYNTKTRKIEPFIPQNKEQVTIYTCGPTVYHYAHVGNLRTYIMEDVLEKGLEYLGYSVKRVMNITDVGHLSSDADTGEDKMLKGAQREHKSVLEVAKFYTDAFFDDCAKLNIRKPETVIPATSCIDYYIEIVQNLLDKGYAYINQGNVYFDTSKLKDYYTLTNHKEDELLVGVRDSVSEDQNKRNKTDFVLWFTKSKFENQELKWNSPWGIGYPGWHIECSGISLKYLGEYLDIHCGGVDNIFPHHTNEIAQSESYLGHPWCKYWFHVEHLNDQNGKMSKSKGNFLTVQLLEQKGYHPLSYRLFCLQSHYRNQLTFTYDSLDTSENAYQKLKKKIQNMEDTGMLQEELVNNYIRNFKEALSNDLNTAEMITCLYNVLKDENLTNHSKLYLIKEYDKVLSLSLLEKEEQQIDEKLLTYIHQKIEERNIAKQNQDYSLADQIREELKQQKILIKDTREGTTFEIIK